MLKKEPFRTSPRHSLYAAHIGDRLLEPLALAARTGEVPGHSVGMTLRPCVLLSYYFGPRQRLVKYRVAEFRHAD